MKKFLSRALLGVLLALAALTLIGAPAHAAGASTDALAPGAVLQMPVLPAGVLLLLSFFGTYATAALNGWLEFVKEPWQKKVVSAVVSVILAAVVIVFYYAMTGDVLPSWPVFVILSIMTAAASYAIVTKRTASRVERSAGVTRKAQELGAKEDTV